MRRVIIESPYAGESTTLPWPLSIIEAIVDRWMNVRYLRKCLRDSLKRGEAPFASHAIYTQPGVLDDNCPMERRMGIHAGFAWGAVAAIRAVYTDRGMSQGMEEGIKAAKVINQKIEFRTLQKNKRPKLEEALV
jgi:hypothetical protein